MLTLRIFLTAYLPLSASGDHMVDGTPAEGVKLEKMNSWCFLLKEMLEHLSIHPPFALKKTID